MDTGGHFLVLVLVQENNMIILKVTLTNGCITHGPDEAVLAWLKQQCGYRPEESFPAKVELSMCRTKEEAYELHDQWVSVLEF